MGDYHAFARRALWGFGRELVEACPIGPGQRVVDVAAGSGNVAIRAAQAGAHVVASDLTPENFQAWRREASAQGADIESLKADAESLPFRDGEFDVVTSAFGAVFAPDHQVVADELLRVCRPGGTIRLIVLALPAGKTAHVTVAVDLPAMFGPVSALSWGDPEHVAGLFGARRVAGAQPATFGSRRLRRRGRVARLLKADHRVAAAMYRRLADASELREDPELRADAGLVDAMLDDAFLGMVHLW
jgi:SAM-dependent methyltransferase